jgi:predicted ATPase
MNTKSIKYNSLNEIKTVAKTILEFGQKTPVWIFEGQMGAGKTTLIKAICDVLVVTSHIPPSKALTSITLIFTESRMKKKRWTLAWRIIYILAKDAS